MPGTFYTEESSPSLRSFRQETEDDQMSASRLRRLDSWQTAYQEPVNTVKEIQEMDMDSIPWQDFEPPRALRQVTDITSEILISLVEDSINNVSSRFQQEKEQRRLEEEQRVQEELAAQQDKGKGKEPYLPIRIAAEDNQAQSQASSSRETAPVVVEPDAAAYVQTQPAVTNVFEKPRPSAFRRFLKRKVLGGESSTDGSIREKLLRTLEGFDESGVDAASGSEPKPKDMRIKLRRTLRQSQPEPEIDIEVECVSCLEDIQQRDAVRLACHSYCADCFTRLIETACESEQRWPPKCCLNTISYTLIRTYIPATLVSTFEARANEWAVPPGERIYCHNPECSLWIKPKHLNHATRVGKCGKGHLTCTLCRNASHGQAECPQDTALQMTNRIAQEEGWMRCYSCRSLVEHGSACQHMTCRCGAEFCYVCGLQWRTCGCSMGDLERVKTQAQARREQREMKEQAESAELREILAQIEEFERQEEERLRLEWEEEMRLEVERRQREFDERVLAESARVRDVELKFQSLHEKLKELHDVQGVALETDQDAAVAAMEVKVKQDIEALATQNFKKKIDMRIEADAKLSALRSKLDDSYKARVRSEIEIENAYYQELARYWQANDDPDAVRRIESAMRKLRRRLDEEHDIWIIWRDSVTAETQDKLEDDLDVQLELMFSAEEILGERLAQKSTDLKKRNFAETKWFEAVILEREKMLSDLEAVELERDADSIFAHHDGTSE